MTKYILNSGGLKRNPIETKKYFKELLTGLGKNPKLLWCFFATLPDPLEDKYQKYIDLFTPYFPKDVQPIHTMATPEDFTKQVKQSDAIYIHGGLVKPLLEIFSKYDLDELFDGKIVGCNSASSLMLATHIWSVDERRYMNPLGFFPIKFIAHFDSDYDKDDARGPIDWQAEKRKLEKYGDPTLPVYALKEGEFVVFET